MPEANGHKKIPFFLPASFQTMPMDNRNAAPQVFLILLPYLSGFPKN